MPDSLLECVGGPLDGEIVSIADAGPVDYVLNYRLVGQAWKSCRQKCKRQAIYRALPEADMLVYIEGELE